MSDGKEGIDLEELKRAAEVVVALIQDPHPGLSTWNDALRNRILYLREVTAPVESMKPDWTTDKTTGAINASTDFVRLSKAVGAIILNEAHSLLSGKFERVGGLIMAQLAHVYRLAPQGPLPGPACPKCKDTGVIDTGNNDLPCDCPAGDTALFNVAGFVMPITGAEIKKRF